jgi:hypothetical protein
MSLNGQHFILRGIPTRNTLLSTVPETQQDSTSHLCVPDEEVSSENSVDEFHHCYIRPEPNESNAESAQRDEEINERIRLRKIKRKHNKQNSLPDKQRSPPTQRQRVRETQHTTNVVVGILVCSTLCLSGVINTGNKIHYIYVSLTSKDKTSVHDVMLKCKGHVVHFHMPNDIKAYPIVSNM